ncbi:MAG TPA: DUF6356 family protein [Alphaproteobacteria bacterium]
MARLSFTEHPESVGESWFDHLGQAWSFGGRMILAGLACCLHGLFPFLFVSTGSRAVRTLFDRMVINRRAPARRDGPEAARPL